MLVHLRLNVPTDLTDAVRDTLSDDARLTNLTHLRGASLKPAGDVFEADVAREAATAVLDDLNAVGLGHRGGIVIDQPLGTPFDAAHDVEEAAHGDPDDAVIWHLVEREAEKASSPTATYLVFLCIATALASIAVITDSAVLVVGAMVVGPEFAVIAAICTGIALGRWRLAARSAATLLWTFAFAIVVIMLAAVLAASLDVVSAADVTRPRPQTGFIWRPDLWSFIVALLAGTAGVLALATDKTSAMVGVFISVTTVPAAGNLALGLAIFDAAEITGSAAQLAMNLAGMIIAGVLTLVVQRLVWRHLSDAMRHRSSERRLRAQLGPSPTSPAAVAPREH